MDKTLDTALNTRDINMKKEIEDITILYNNPTINNPHYYKESAEETPYILDNIRKSELQNLYYDYISRYRNMPIEAIEESNMFYILDGYEELDEVMPSDYFRELLGIQTGDFMRQKERFVFPIMDQLQTIIGFVGYDYDETSYKYLMTFSKFANKYNSFYNMQNISKAYKNDICIVEEGIFDSIRLNSVGYNNNLAIMGKKLSDFHIRILQRFSLVILIPDNDDVGIKAAQNWGKDIMNKKKPKFGMENPFDTGTNNTRVATIVLPKKEFVKKTIDAETQETKEITKQIKDIDDYLSESENVKEFNRVYKRIIKDFQNPLITSKRYNLK